MSSSLQPVATKVEEKQNHAISLTILRDPNNQKGTKVASAGLGKMGATHLVDSPNVPLNAFFGIPDEVSRDPMAPLASGLWGFTAPAPMVSSSRLDHAKMQLFRVVVDHSGYIQLLLL